MKTLHIEWKHYDVDGNTCTRCGETGATLQQLFGGLREELATKGVELDFQETRLTEHELPHSNSLLFNGTPIEELLDGVTVVYNHCASCCKLTGRDTSCRAIQAEGKTYEAIPAAMIRQAALKAAGLRKPLLVLNEPITACC